MEISLFLHQKIRVPTSVGLKMSEFSLVVVPPPGPATKPGVDPWPLFGLMVWAWTTSLVMAFLLGMGCCCLCYWPRQSHMKTEAGGMHKRHNTSWRTWLWEGAEQLLAKLVLTLAESSGRTVRPGSPMAGDYGSPRREMEEGHPPDLLSRGHIAVVTPPRSNSVGRESGLEGLRAWEEHHVMESEMPSAREGASRVRDRNPSRALEMMLEGASPEASRHWMA